MGFGKDTLIPVLIGLGLYSQNCELNLANNTTMLLALFVLLEDHQRIERLERHLDYLERIEFCEHREEHDDCCHDHFGRRRNSRNWW